MSYATMSASDLTVPYRAGFCVGLGVSSFTGEAAVRPWAFPDVARPQLNTSTTDEGAQPRTIHFEEGFIDRKDHYEAALKGAASLNVKGWGTVSPQGSLDVLYDMQLDSRTQHYVVIARFETATCNVLATSTYQPTLSQRAAADLQKHGPKWWAEQYGTHFIAGYVVGGHVVGVASITSQSSQHALETKAKLQAKFGCGWLGKAKGAVDWNSDASTTGCDVKTKCHCAGARILDVGTNDIFALRKAAQLHMREGTGLKCQAILWPFTHLESYNNTEALYQGPLELFSWQHDPVCLVRMLNLEHARLQRLQKSLHVCNSSESKESYQAVRDKVKHALKALQNIRNYTDVVKVDENHQGFDEKIHQAIFVAEESENTLLGLQRAAQPGPTASTSSQTLPNPSPPRSARQPQMRKGGVTIIKNKDDWTAVHQNAGNNTVIASFNASWCGPCRMIYPYYEELSAQYIGVTFLKVDVDAVEAVAQECGISAMPTFQVWRGNQKVDELVGASKDKLKALVWKHV